MSETINIRKAVLDDLPQIVEVDGEAFGSHAYGHLVLRQFFDIAEKFFFVAENERIVGYILGAVASEDSEGWILSLAVRSSARKMGIGEKLTQKLIDGLVDNGAGNILLTVEQQNIGAKKLYEKFGFAEYKFESGYYGANEDRIIMKYSLK